MMFCAEPDCPGGHPCNCVAGAYAAKIKRADAALGIKVLPGGKVIYPELRPEIKVQLIKEIWGVDITMNRFEADVIEAAMELQEAEMGAQYGPMVHVITKAKDRLTEVCAILASENDGKWERPS